MSEEMENDISDLFEKCRDLQDADPMFILKLSMGQFTLQDIQSILERMNKVVVNIGDGLTLLHLAAQNGHLEVVRYLAGEKNHPLELKTIAGETPLDQSAWRGHTAVAIELLKFGADVDCTTNGKYTPLHRCAFYDHKQLAGLLCLAGADQKARDCNGQTAYEVAVENGNDEVAQLLKPMLSANGADITGIQYATNNPKHPNFRPEARAALFALAGLEFR